MPRTTTDPLLTAGDPTVHLVERLYDMGTPPPQWGRIKGTTRVWITAQLPDGLKQAEGQDLDTAAINYMALYLACPDDQRPHPVPTTTEDP